MRIVAGLTAWLVLPFVASCQTPPELALTIELQPAETVAGVETPAPPARGPAPAFSQGTPIEAVFTITNRGAEPYKYHDRNSDRSGRMDEYAIEVIDGTGAQLPDPRRNWSGPGGGPGGVYEIAPGESFSKRILLNQWVPPLLPGRYAAIGVYNPRYYAAAGVAPAPARSVGVDFEIAASEAGEMQAYIDRLGGTLRTGPPESKERIVQYLAFTGERAALPYLIEAFYVGKNATFRASESERYVGDRDAFRDLLLEALQERGPAEGMLWVLTSRFGVPRSQTLAPLVKALQSDDAGQRAQAARELTHYAELGEEALRPLLSVAGDPEAKVRRAVVGALWAYPQPEAFRALVVEAKDVDVEVRTTAAFSLQHRKEPEAVPALQALLDDEAAVAQEAVRSLTAIGSSEAANALRAGMRLADERLRLRCAAGLLQLGDDSVRPLLADALGKADARMAELIRQLLGNAVQMRRIPGPGENGSPWAYGNGPWITWLRGE
ncbi:MAG: HEAT repeat domain-containing protein [Armatimonadetes bacterium]|nr:HEAT repeat domain-containing protein [Armatimonadota bacterium]